MFCSGLETLIHAQPGALVHSLVPDVVDASRIAESLARLAGLLADIPFILEWHVPTEKVITEWRLPVARPGSGLFRLSRWRAKCFRPCEVNAIDYLTHPAHMIRVTARG